MKQAFLAAGPAWVWGKSYLNILAITVISAAEIIGGSSNWYRLKYGFSP